MKEIDDNYIKAASVLYQTFKIWLPKHKSAFSPRKFTVPQIQVLIWLRILPACTAHDLRPNALWDEELWQVIEPLRLAGKMSYRRLVEIVSESKKLRDVLELTEVPHHSTLCHAERYGDEID